MAKHRTFPLQRLRRARVFQYVLVTIALSAVRILGALPARWVLRCADASALFVALVNTRARRIAYENLGVVFGADFPRAERRRIFHGTYRNLLRSALILAHVQPLTEAKWRRWVDMPEGIEDEPRFARLVKEGGLIVSGHLGNWELLLGMRVAFQRMPKTVFLAEAIPHEIINAALMRLRSHADLLTALRRGGARMVARVVSEAGIAGLLIDRNVRKSQGGIYVPFLGLEARTTPLAAWAALRYDKPIHTLTCLPTPDGRYRIEAGDDVTLGIEDVPEAQRQYEIMRRLNHVLGEQIRRDPTIWQWRLKRWKSRPTEACGRYPRYSEHDPD